MPKGRCDLLFHEPFSFHANQPLYGDRVLPNFLTFDLDQDLSTSTNPHRSHRYLRPPSRVCPRSLTSMQLQARQSTSEACIPELLARPFCREGSVQDPALAEFPNDSGCGTDSGLTNTCVLKWCAARNCGFDSTAAFTRHHSNCRISLDSNKCGQHLCGDLPAPGATTRRI